MTNTQSPDTIDRLVGLDPKMNTFAVRHQRDKVVAATQKSEDGLFDPALPGLSLADDAAPEQQDAQDEDAADHRIDGQA
jgi:uncharacterized protein YciW